MACLAPSCALFRAQSSINAALQDHDLVGAVEGLQQQLRLDCSHDVERLLFVRQSRPASQRMSLNLFMAMDRLSHLRDHHRFYVLIAMVHSALQLDDAVCLAELKPRLCQAACLECVPSRQLIVPGRNREHPFKQLISARSCLLQVELRGRNMVACQQIAPPTLSCWKRCHGPNCRLMYCCAAPQILSKRCCPVVCWNSSVTVSRQVCLGSNSTFVGHVLTRCVPPHGRITSPFCARSWLGWMRSRPTVRASNCSTSCALGC